MMRTLLKSNWESEASILVRNSALLSLSPGVIELSLDRSNRLMISQSKKDVWLSYKLHCEQIGRRVVQLSKWRTFWPDNVHTLSKGEGHQQLVVS